MLASSILVYSLSGSRLSMCCRPYGGGGATGTLAGGLDVFIGCRLCCLTGQTYRQWVTADEVCLARAVMPPAGRGRGAETPDRVHSGATKTEHEDDESSHVEPARTARLTHRH